MEKIRPKTHLGWCNQMQKNRRKIMGISTTQNLKLVSERRISGCHEPYSARYRNHLHPPNVNFFFGFRSFLKLLHPWPLELTLRGKGQPESTFQRPDFGGKGISGLGPRIENGEMFIDIHGSGYLIYKGFLVKSYEASSVNDALFPFQGCSCWRFSVDKKSGWKNHLEDSWGL